MPLQPQKLLYLVIFFFPLTLAGQSVSISPLSGEVNTAFGVSVTGTGTSWSSSHCVEFSDGVSTFTMAGNASTASSITGTLIIPAGANASANYDITVYDDNLGNCSGVTDGTCSNCFEVTATVEVSLVSPSTAV